MPLLEWLGLIKPSVIGIDISSTTVKCIELSKAGDTWSVEHYGIVPVGESGADDESGSVKLMAKAIKEALRVGQFTSKHAAISIPASSAICKVIQMPSFIKPAELGMQVTLEAAKHIPYSIDEVYLDYQVLGPSQDVENENDVLIVAARVDAVDTKLKAAELAGLQVNFVDINSYALERSVSVIPSIGDSQECIALVDIGASSTHICVFNQGKNIYTREQEFGGKMLTESIMQQYGMTFQEAGKNKRENTLPEDYERSVLAPFLETLSQEIQRGMDFFYSATEYSSVDKLAIGGATLQDLKSIEVLGQKLGLNAVPVNPLEAIKIKNPDAEKQLANDNGALMVCCGLAMRGEMG